MNNAGLAKHIRGRADRIMETRHKSNLEAYDDARDNAELLCVLARILEGRPVEQAFGGACIWGYSTPIGKALAEPGARQAVAPPPETDDVRAVRIGHPESGFYLAVREQARVHLYDDGPDDLAMTWGPVEQASIMTASMARTVAAAWIRVMDDSGVEIEEVEAS